MPYNHSTTFEGDVAACTEWLNFARGHLRIMLNLKVANNFQTFFPAPEVEVQIWTKPNRIYVKAGNELAIAYSDVTQAIDARTVFSTDTRLNVPPTTPSVPTPTFGEANHLIGDMYWASEKTPEAVSWAGKYLYYRGVRITPPFSGDVMAAAVASSSGGRVKLWATDSISRIYLLTVQKVSGVWTVTSPQTGIISSDSEVRGLVFSGDSKTLIFFVARSSSVKIYKLSISSDSSSPYYPFNGTNTPTLLTSGTIATAGSYTYGSEYGYTVSDVVDGWSDAEQRYAAHITGHKTGMTSRFTGAISYSAATGLGISFIGFPKMYGDVLYGFGLSPLSATQNGSGSTSFTTTGGYTYTFQTWEATSGSRSSTTSGTDSLSITTPVYLITVDVLTGNWTKTYFSSGYALTDNSATASSGSGTVTGRAVERVSGDSSRVQTYHEESIFPVYFSDAYYGLTISRVNTGDLSETTAHYTNRVRICNKGVNTDIGIVVYGDSSTAAVSGPSFVTGSQILFYYTDFGSGIPRPLTDSSTGTAGISLGSSSSVSVADTNFAMTKKQLVVCIKDSFPNITGPDTLLRKTLIFSLNKTARTATLKNTLNYDIREYPSSTVGRIAVTKYPKLK